MVADAAPDAELLRLLDAHASAARYDGSTIGSTRYSAGATRAALLAYLAAAYVRRGIAGRDPILHTHIEDGLPDDHPLAWVAACANCGAGLNVGNECMQTWVETGKGAYCLPCFIAALGGLEEAAAIDDDWALPAAASANCQEDDGDA